MLNHILLKLATFVVRSSARWVLQLERTGREDRRKLVALPCPRRRVGSARPAEFDLRAEVDFIEARKSAIPRLAAI